MQVLSQFHHMIALNNSNDNFASSFLLNPNINEPSRPFLLTILIALSLAIIIVLTVLGNILVLIALCVDFALRSPTHLLMGNLACADLLLGNPVVHFILIYQKGKIKICFLLFI
jgi:hypothetical protein